MWSGTSVYLNNIAQVVWPQTCQYLVGRLEGIFFSMMSTVLEMNLISSTVSFPLAQHKAAGFQMGKKRESYVELLQVPVFQVI